jgi:transcriptional regulator with XRE-family HTH domain
LGERLKYARERAGLTMAQVKERADIGGSSLSD